MPELHKVPHSKLNQKQLLGGETHPHIVLLVIIHYSRRVHSCSNMKIPYLYHALKKARQSRPVPPTLEVSRTHHPHTYLVLETACDELQRNQQLKEIRQVIASTNAEGNIKKQGKSHRINKAVRNNKNLTRTYSEYRRCYSELSSNTDLNQNSKFYQNSEHTYTEL